MEPVVPKDLLLPLPAPFWLLTALLLLSFALHILFVNFMLGGSLLALLAEIRGLKNRDWDVIGHEIAKTITVNKSIAVVLGVAPLLTISVLYTVWFYTATTLTGHTWLTVVPLVILAFLLSYAHKYSWEKLAHSKGLHITIAAAASAVFLSIPLIFLAEINLMLYPEKWRGIASFWDALLLPNVLPRYFHFMAATVALAGLFCAWHFGRAKYFAGLQLETLTRGEVVRSFYAVALAATSAQLFLGPLLFLTLPAHVISASLTLILVMIVALAGIAVRWLWLEVIGTGGEPRLARIVGLLTVVVVLMIWARHDIRETAIAPHRALVAAKTADYTVKMMQAHNYLVMPGGLGGTVLSPGAQAFSRRCASCHAMDSRLVGPALKEAAALYRGNPEGIVTWALQPGRRRPDYPPMPAQQVPRDELLQIANYILDIAIKQ